MEPLGDDWHVQIRSLISASLGQITDSFRLISLRFEDDCWKVRFVLESESAQSLEAADEIFENFDSDSWNAICGWRTHGDVKFSSAVDQKIQKEIIISDGEISREQTEQAFWLYRRREAIDL